MVLWSCVKPAAFSYMSAAFHKPVLNQNVSVFGAARIPKSERLVAFEVVISCCSHFVFLNSQCFHDAFPEPVARFVFFISRCFYDAFAERVACFPFLNVRCFYDTFHERVA